MDENKHREQNKGNIIDLGPALEEKERAERAEAKRLAKESRGPLGRRILSLVLVLAIVLAAVLLTINWERINFDALRRSISYWGTEQSETGQTTAFSYEKGNDNCFATLGKNLVYASIGASSYTITAGMRCLKPTSSWIRLPWRWAARRRRPMISAGGT